MNRIEIIQSYINKYSYKNYLEIGVEGGHCFTAVKCENKTGVDPDKSSKATVHKTSDDFFAENKEKFDIIFIDGLHHSDAVEKDIANSLECLSEGGTVLMHDCLPTNEFMQLIPLTTQDEWTGDTWKAYVKCRQERSDVSMFVINDDHGVGVIRKGFQNKLNISVDINYQNFEIYKQEWMNVISVEDFINHLKN